MHLKPPRHRVVLACLAVAGTVVATVPAGALAAAPATPSHASAAAAAGARQRVIVELDGAAAVAAVDALGLGATASGKPAPRGSAAARTAQSDRASAVRTQRSVLQQRYRGLETQARAKGVDTRVEHEFGLLFNGITMTVAADDLEALRSMPGVRSVRPEGTMRALVTDDANELVGNLAVRARLDPSGRPVDGTGVTVAVIDTGIDHSHPDLGSGFGPGHKVVGGYDFVNDDPDPMDDNGHGTHVAGIVAARAASPAGVTGAAPGASLMAYKVLDEQGSGTDTDIMSGIEAAADPANPHRADVINLSLGNPYGTSEDPVARTATAAAASGVLVVASAGNEGAYWTVGSPAAAPGVLAVGASTSGVRIPVLTVPGESEPLTTYRGGRSANPPVTPVTAAVVHVGDGTPQDWARVGDVAGKVVTGHQFPSPNPYEVGPEELELWREAERRGAVAYVGGVYLSEPVARGSQQSRVNPLDEQAASALSGDISRHDPALAASRLPIFAATSSRPDGSGDDLRMDRLVIVGIDSGQSELMAALAARGGSVTLSGRDSTDEIASFSSRGPETAGLGLKPDIVAPGVEIRSTVPASVRPGGYERLSGTSMAAPLVAGSAALLGQLHPGQSADQMRAQLIGSALPLAGPDLLTQGAGRLDTAATADARLAASPSTVSFGLPHMDRARVSGTRHVMVTNTSATRLTGRVTVDGPAAVSPSRLSIPAGGSARLTLTVDRARPDTTDDLTTIISGRVTVTPDAGPRLTVPYLMMAIPLYVEPAVDPTIDGTTDVYVTTPTPLAAAPVLSASPRKGRTVTVTTRPTTDPRYYVATLSGLRTGIYRLTARATTTTGIRQLGVGAVEVDVRNPAGTRWTPIGPNSSGGDTHVTSTRPSQGVMVTGTRPGAWLTRDRGQSWTQLNHTPVRGDALRRPQLVVDSRDPDQWWELVVSVHPSSAPSGSNLMRTTNRGRTWERLEGPSTPVDALVADPETKVLLAYQTGTSLYVASRDGGATWAPVDLGPIAAENYVASAQFGGDDLYVWAGQAIWVIRDFASGTPAAPVRAFTGDLSTTLLATFDVDGPTVAVVALGQNGGLYVSSDRGQTWLKTSRSSGGLVQVSQGLIFHDDLRGGSAISRDGGVTWTDTPKPTEFGVVTDLDVWSDGFETIGDSSGLYRSTSAAGGALTYSRIGVQAASVSSLAAVGGHLLAATDTGTYRTVTTNTAPEWGAGSGEGMFGAGSGPLATSAAAPKAVWRVGLGDLGFAVQRSDDEGASWRDLGDPTVGQVGALAVDPADPDRIAYTWRTFTATGIAVTTDGGQTWRSRSLGTLLTAVAFDPARPGRLWIGGYSGLWRTDDLGATTTQVSTAEVTALGFRGSRLVVGGTAIRLSDDGGHTLTKADTGPLRLSVSSLVNVGGTLYAGTTQRWMPGTLPNGGRGVLRSTDGGKTWDNISRGMPNLEVASLAASPDGRYLFAGVEQGGVHRIRLR